MSQPLWKLMEAAYLEGRKPGNCDRFGYAAELRVVADWLDGFIRMYPTHSELRGMIMVSAMLRVEAGLAQEGQ